VLLVEDDETYRYLAEKTFAKTQVPSRLQVAATGGEALRLLDQAMHDGIRLPQLILLDLKLPGTNGFEIIQYLHNNNLPIPVVVLSSSDAPEDIHRSYELKAAAYVQKPSGAREFREFVDSLLHFWQRHVHFPDDV